MITPRDLLDANALLDAHPAGSALLRLAELLSPATLIEPELLRNIRLDCVPSAAVDVEQALWFSELIRSRGDQGIAFTAPVRAALRERLRQRVETDRDQVLKAKRTMAALHVGLSPLLALEESLAWSEVFGDIAALHAAAETLLDALLAQRVGLDHWLARAWDGLPLPLRQTPAGLGLAQIAAQRGADIEVPALADLDIGRVWHLLPLVPLFLRRDGSQLRVGVPVAEASHGIRVPDTRPVVLDLAWDEAGPSGAVRRSVRGRAGDVFEVGDAAVDIRTLAGAHYELAPLEGRSAGPDVDGGLEIEVLAAAQGQSILLSYGGADSPRHILFDCGPENTYRQLQQRLKALPDRQGQIELLVLTHVDADRVGGALRLLDDKSLSIGFDDIWFNGWRHLPEGSS